LLEKLELMLVEVTSLMKMAPPCWLVHPEKDELEIFSSFTLWTKTAPPLIREVWFSNVKLLKMTCKLSEMWTAPPSKDFEY